MVKNNMEATTNAVTEEATAIFPSRFNDLCVITCTVVLLPIHSTSLGSGSHSPFSIHVYELEPVSMWPGGQLKVIVFPITVGSLYSMMLIKSSTI